jgi:hypothetical protein
MAGKNNQVKNQEFASWARISPDMTKEITITDRAAVKIRALRAGTKQDHGLHVKVVEGGCSGFEYKMAVDAAARESCTFFDLVIGRTRTARPARLATEILLSSLR